MRHAVQDIRYAVRLLLRSPGFALVAILTLAVGIGANTAIFSVVSAVLLKPLPYRDAGRLMTAGMSVPEYREIRAGVKSFDGVALWASNLYNLSLEGESAQILGGVVTPEFFPLLGNPLLGRAFTPESDREREAILSYALWQRRFGADPAIVGKTIHLNREAHTIVGVMPPEFQYPRPDFKVWVPMGSAMTAAPGQMENRSLRIFRAVAHLAPGVEPAAALREVALVAKRLEKEFPETNLGFEFEFVPLRERLVGDLRPALLAALGAVGLVLLIACANVANLLLARTAARGTEMALRAALGAGRGRIVGQLLIESAVLSLAGGAAGLALASWAIDLLPRFEAGTVPRAEFARLDPGVLLFTLAASILTTALFGIVPAIQASRASLADGIRGGDRGGEGRRTGRRLRGALVAAEIAVSVIVLVGAGLVVRTFLNLVGGEAGFVAEGAVTAQVGLQQFTEPARRASLALEIERRLLEIPGVTAAGAGSGQPPATPQRGSSFEVEGGPALEGNDRFAYFIGATPGYFRALGAPVREGRAFDERDDARGEKVAIVCLSLARRLFPQGSAIGRRLRLTNPDQSPDWRTIVGVVPDMKYRGMDDPGRAAIYTPFAQTPFLWAYVFVRTAGEPGRVIPAVRSAVASVNPDLEAADVVPLREVVDRAVAAPRLNMLLFSLFAAAALLLAAIGVYGVLACSVEQRRREMGVRLALGARGSDILRLVLGEGLLLALGGVVAGLVAAAGAARFMESLLYGVTPTDPATYAAISALLLAVAFLACYVPARRATRVDPAVTLRSE